MRPRGFLRSDEKGTALVETALTLPLLFALILGAAEFTRVAFTSIEMVSAAKAGVAYGAERGGTTGDTTGITWAAQHDAPNIVGFTATPSSSYACSDGSTVDTTKPINTQCTTSHIQQTLTVQTSVTMDPLIHVPGLPTQYTINGSASQICLQ
jgi:Flp pilus assembly protein TadG